MSHSDISMNKPDGIVIKRKLIISLFFIAVILISHFLLKTGNMLFIAGFLALPFILMLLNRPDLAFLLGVIADASEISIGGMHFLTVGILSQLLIIASLILSKTLIGSSHKIKFFEDRPLRLFIGVIVILMVFRGTGLRFLGSSTWGGMTYVRIILAISFYWAIRGLNISSKQIRICIIGSVLAGIAGAAVQRSGFVAVTSEMSTLQQSVAQTRLIWVVPMVYAMFPVILAVRWRVAWFKWIMWIALIGLIGMSGFRSRLVLLIMVSAIFGFIQSRNRIRYLISVVGIGLVLWVGVVLTSPYYPKGLQRAVSFVPGAYTDARVSEDAAGSIEWRVEIWKYCLEQSSQYLLIGRGSTFNVWDTSANLSQFDISTFTPWFAFETRSYHSGPLSLLIDYGAAGFIVGLWIAMAIFFRLWRVASQLVRVNTLESRYALALVAWVLYELVAFFLVYGDMVKFSNLILRAAIVTVLSSSILKNREISGIAMNENE